MMYSPAVHAVSHTMNKQQANQIINKLNKLENKKKKTRSPRRKPKLQGGMTCCLSECALKYLRARENPFGSSPACVPTEFNQPSQKLTSRARGTFSTGPGGLGGVILSPWAMWYNDGQSASGTGYPPAVLASTSTFAPGAGIALPSFPDVATSMAVQVGGDTQLGSVEMVGNSHISVRLVGAGLRCRNITPMMYRGGTVLGLEEPSHNSLRYYGISNLYEIQTAESGNIDGQWNSIVYHPTDSDDLDYTNQLFTINQIGDTTIATNSLQKHFMGYAAAAPSSQVQVYEWEAISHFEILGWHAAGLTTSPSDPSGLGIIGSLTSSPKSRENIVGDRTKWVDTLISAATDPRVLKMASGVGAYLANQYASRRPQPLMPPYRNIELVD